MKFIKLALVVMLVAPSLLMQGMDQAAGSMVACFSKIVPSKEMKKSILALDIVKQLEEHYVKVGCATCFFCSDEYYIGINLFEKNSNLPIGYIELNLIPKTSNGYYVVLRIDPAHRNKGYAQKLINVAISIMDLYKIQHRHWSASPMDKTTKLDRLENLYKRYGGQTTDKGKHVAFMQWSAPQTTTTQNQLRSSL